MTLNPDPFKSDLWHMRTALSLARRSLGDVWPNPAVGCVLVREDLAGRVVGRGWTQKGGRPHAESEAIRRAGKMARGATAYVTLEPCCHVGKTMPCTDALIEAGIVRVVVAMVDPDPRVKGKGLAQLRKNGVTVKIDLLKADAELLNSGFIFRTTKRKPLTTLKVATTSDGYIASSIGNSQWITGELARRYGHMLRARHDAILTGIGTIEADDPLLTCRLEGLENKSPIRVIVDTHGRMSASSAVAKSVQKFPVWRFSGRDNANSGTSNKFKDIFCPIRSDGHLNLTKVLSTLADFGITRLLVEAGPRLTTSFLKSNLVDQIYWFRSASIMGGNGQAVFNSLNVESLTDLYEFDRIKTTDIGQDNLEIYSRRHSA